MKLLLVAFAGVFAVVWFAALAWAVQIGMLLRALRLRHPSEHQRIVGGLRWSWTVHFNPAAGSRLLHFIVSAQSGALGDRKLMNLLGRLRISRVIATAGLVVLSGLLAVLFTLRPK